MRVALEELLDKSDYSTYKLVILTAKRALQIVEGAPKLTNTPETAKPIAIALQEICEGKIKYAKGKSR